MKDLTHYILPIAVLKDLLSAGLAHLETVEDSGGGPYMPAADQGLTEKERAIGIAQHEGLVAAIAGLEEELRHLVPENASGGAPWIRSLLADLVIAYVEAAEEHEDYDPFHEKDPELRINDFITWLTVREESGAFKPDTHQDEIDLQARDDEEAERARGAYGTPEDGGYISPEEAQKRLPSYVSHSRDIDVIEMVFYEDIPQEGEEHEKVNGLLHMLYGDNAELDWRDDRTVWVTLR
jgi:hypothetical protein